MRNTQNTNPRGLEKYHRRPTWGVTVIGQSGELVNYIEPYLEKWWAWKHSQLHTQNKETWRCAGGGTHTNAHEASGYSHAQTPALQLDLKPNVTPLSKGFPRQKYWSGMPFPSPGDWTCVSCASCIGRQILYHWAAREAHSLKLPRGEGQVKSWKDKFTNLDRRV